jgi:hypothetical protein
MAGDTSPVTRRTTQVHNAGPKFAADTPSVESDSRLRRHIVGRISCLARLPIYGLGLILLVLKTAVKIPIAFIVTPIAACFGKKGSWTFSGVAKDAIMVGSLMDRMGCTALCVIYAPPKQYRSLGCAASDTFKIVVRASYQKGSAVGETSTVDEVFERAILLRAQYHKCIVDQEENSVLDHVYHDDFILLDEQPCRGDSETLQKLKSMTIKIGNDPTACKTLARMKVLAG